MFVLKPAKLDYCDIIVTESPFGTTNDILVEKHIDSGALVVKVATESDMPVFADDSAYLHYLIKMQKLGATRKQCVLLIVGGYSEFSAEMSTNWQLLGGTCILLDSEKRMEKVLIDLATVAQNAIDDMLIAVPYFSYDLVEREKGATNAFPFLIQLLSAVDNNESLEMLGIPGNKSQKIRERLGIPGNLEIFRYKQT